MFREIYMPKNMDIVPMEDKYHIFKFKDSINYEYTDDQFWKDIDKITPILKYEQYRLSRDTLFNLDDRLSDMGDMFMIMLNKYIRDIQENTHHYNKHDIVVLIAKGKDAYEEVLNSNANLPHIVPSNFRFRFL